MSSDQPVTDVVETLEDATEADDVCLRDILDEFGSASFPPVLLAVSVLLISPLSGIPLFSSAIGMIIFLIASQGMLGARHIWLPSRVTDRRLKTRRAQDFLRRLRRLADWLDQRTDARWAQLVSPPASRVLYGICAFSGLFIPVLEFVPLSSSLIGAEVALISIALLTRDGAMAAVGLVMLCIAASIPLAAYVALLA